MRSRLFLLFLIVLTSGMMLWGAKGRGHETAPAKIGRHQDKSSYVIGPMDELDISVWKQPNVSSEEDVRPDGKISLPLLNDVQAAGYTPMQLAERITEKLKKFVTDPQVTVTVVHANSWRIFVLGQVNRPGPIQLFPGMTVLQALASAGGLTPYANEKKIYVLRKVSGGEKRLMFNFKRASRGLPSGDIKLRPDDTIFVP